MMGRTTSDIDIAMSSNVVECGNVCATEQELLEGETFVPMLRDDLIQSLQIRADDCSVERDVGIVVAVAVFEVFEDRASLLKEELLARSIRIVDGITRNGCSDRERILKTFPVDGVLREARSQTTLGLVVPHDHA